jgi:phage-related protein
VGIGREVASAYIKVHGDLSDFRHDLDKAGPITEKAARKNAEKFADAWGKNLEKRVNDKWEGIISAMGSDKASDWQRAFSHFDSTGLDDAQQKVLDFANNMRQLGNLTSEEYAKMKKAVIGQIGVMKDEEKAQRDLNEQTKEAIRLNDAMAEGERRAGEIRKKQYDEASAENDAYDGRRRKTMEEAIRENERWSRTLDGIRKNNAIKDMESDFRKLAETMNSNDMAKFAKSFDNLHQARARIYDVTAAMEQQGRISREQSEKMQKDINDYIERINAEVKAEKDASDAKSKAMRDALDETNRLRDAQDKYNASLSGMARNIHFQKMESDFRNLAAAMDSNDWSHFARGADDVEHMRRNIANTAGEMHRLGRMTDDEFKHIMDNVHNVTGTFKSMERDGSGMFASLRAGAGHFASAMGTVGNATRGMREHLQGFAGLNVFGDMIEGGLEFLHNLDRIAVSSANLSLKLSAMASIGGSALAGLFVIADDLGKSLGGISALLPAFATGFGFMAYVGMSALQGMGKKYKKEIEAWKESLLDTLNKGLQPAMDRFSTVMLPTLKKNLNLVAAAEGRLFGAILDGITKSAGSKGMTAMFKRMDDAMDKSHAGVKSFINAWVTLGAAGTKYFDRFATWFNKLGASFDAFITKADKSGQIDKWIERGIKGFKDLGRTIDGTFGIFNAIADAARKAGSGGLSEFADKLQAAAKAMQETGFQNTLATLFRGFRDEVGKIGDAIAGLGPAMQSVMPSIATALGNLGTGIAAIIKDVGDILSNPLVQQGIRDFTGGISTAIGLLEPAVKPFADSIGNMLTLLGKIVESVAKIATAFTVSVGPVLDSMSKKVQTLLDPLSAAATNAITVLTPVIGAIDKYIVAPLVSAVHSALLPAIGDFIGKAGPFLQKVVTDLGPSFTTLAKDVLPNVLKFAGELLDPLGKLFDLFTPTLNDALKKIGTSFGTLASAMRIAKGEARPEDWGILFHGFSTEGLDQSIKDTQTKIEHVQHMNWGEIFQQLLTGDMSLGLAGIGAKFGEFGSNTLFPFMSQQIGQLINAVGVLFGGPGDPKLNALSDKVDEWIAGAFGNLFDNILPDLQKSNENLSHTITTALDSWWGGIKGMFQDWFKSTFGFGNDSSKTPGADITGSGMGGGGAGGKGSGVMGKITEEMLGNATDPKQPVTDWFTGFQSNLNDNMASLGAAIGQMGAGLMEAWNGFWSGFGSVVGPIWDGIIQWISGALGNIGTAIGGFMGNIGTMWNGFWGQVGQTVSQIWSQISGWISGAVGGIVGNISSFIGTVSGIWNGFWAGVGATVSSLWAQVTGWISGAVGQIIGNISSFGSTVAGIWNGLWSGVWGRVSSIWSQITGWISGQVGAIIGRIGGFGGTIMGIWNGIWSGVQGYVQGAWSGIVGAVSGGVNNVMGWIRGLPGQISGALSGLWGLLTGAGDAIMGGFLNGLTSAWNNVTNFVGGIAGWIAANKGPISYDKTLLVPAGQAIMGGLESSMKGAFGPVMDFVTSMAGMMAGAFDKSEMYVAGQNASSGLADGLLANKSKITAAYANLGTFATGASLGSINVTGTPGADRSSGTPGKSVTLGPGAVSLQVTTAATDPNIVASKVTDSLDDAFARFTSI